MPECLLSALGQDYVSRLFSSHNGFLSLVFRSRQAAPEISFLASNLVKPCFLVIWKELITFVWMFIGLGLFK